MNTVKAIKGNKVYTIDKTMQKQYLGDGFDIVDESGKAISYAKGKTVSYDEFMELKKAHEDLMNHHEILENAHKELQALYDDAVKQLVPEKDNAPQSEQPKAEETPKPDKQAKNK